MKRDPSRVPPFPVVNLEVTDDGHVRLDGRPVTVPDGDPAAQAGIAAVAQHVDEMGLEAVRVRAVAPEGEFTMVVWSDGEAADTTPEPVAEPQGRRGIIVITAVAAGALIMVGTGAALVAALDDGEPVPVASATPALPGAGANLPVEAPAEYGQTADWSVVVDDRSPALPTADGRIVVTTPDDKILALDAKTGATTWSGRDPEADLHLSHIGDRPVVASSSGTTLRLWPMDITDPAGVPPISLDLGNQATVTYQGSVPLIELENQTVAMVDGDQLTRRDVPVGADPVMATPEGVIALGPDAWWRITTSDDPAENPLPRPADAAGAPVRAVAAADEQIVVIWPTTDNQTDVLALVDLTTNTIRTEAAVPAPAPGYPDDAPVRDPDGTTMSVGSVLIDHGPRPLIADLGEIEPTAIEARTVYGTARRQPAAIRWGADAEPLPGDDVPGDVVPPAAVTAERAYVVTEKVDQTLLYALPRTDGSPL